MKKCAKCKIKKPFDEFHKCKRNKDGFQYYCKDCDNTCKKKNYYINHEEEKGKRNSYYKNNKEDT
jgi:hypothetical protein